MRVQKVPTAPEPRQDRPDRDSRSSDRNSDRNSRPTATAGTDRNTNGAARGNSKFDAEGGYVATTNKPKKSFSEGRCFFIYSGIPLNL